MLDWLIDRLINWVNWARSKWILWSDCNVCSHVFQGQVSWPWLIAEVLVLLQHTDWSLSLINMQMCSGIQCSIGRAASYTCHLWLRCPTSSSHTVGAAWLCLPGGDKGLCCCCRGQLALWAPQSSCALLIKLSTSLASALVMKFVFVLPQSRYSWSEHLFFFHTPPTLCNPVLNCEPVAHIPLSGEEYGDKCYG